MRIQHLFSLTLAVTMTLLSWAPASAQDISVDELIDNYFEVIGGEDAWQEVTAIRMTGKTNTQGMEFPMTVISMEPNLQKVEVNIQEKQLIDAFDGETAWGINPFMGGTEPQKKTEEESREMAKNEFRNEFFNYQEKGHQVSIEGTEEIDGIETIKVKLIRVEGDERLYFFDPEVYVPIMMRSYVQVGPQKGTAIDTYFSDYDEVDGLIFAHSMEQKINGQTFMQMSMENIELNPEGITKEDFAFPEK